MLTKETDNFFKSYSYTDPILNWRLGRNDSISGSNYAMADGYYECSVHLIDECLKNNQNKKADVWIFPIMFCVNQFIELYLKGILTQIEQIDMQTQWDWQIDIFKGSHSIDKLCHKLYDYQKNNPKKKIALLDEIQIIVDFTEILVEQNGFDFTFPRYPTAINKDKNTKSKQPNLPQFFNNEFENCGLNLKMYLKWVIEMHNILDGIACNVEAQIEYLCEGVIK